MISKSSVEAISDQGSRKASLFFLPLAFVAALCCIIFLNGSPKMVREIGFRKALPAEVLPHVSFGLRFLVADLLWLDLIQEIDFKDSLTQGRGWVFQMLDGVTTLDPRYRIAYSAGATVLSVAIQDVEGAKIIFDRGVARYPKDWVLSYKAAGHYLNEIGDCERAGTLYKNAVENGAPQWVSALASRLFSATGQTAMARSILVDSIERFKGTSTEDHLRKRLYELESGKTSFAQLNCKK
jgi:hypothetical protein